MRAPPPPLLPLRWMLRNDDAAGPTFSRRRRRRALSITVAAAFFVVAASLAEERRKTTAAREAAPASDRRRRFSSLSLSLVHSGSRARRVSGSRRVDPLRSEPLRAARRETPASRVADGRQPKAVRTLPGWSSLQMSSRRRRRLQWPKPRPPPSRRRRRICRLPSESSQFRPRKREQPSGRLKTGHIRCRVFVVVVVVAADSVLLLLRLPNHLEQRARASEMSGQTD